MSIDLEEFGKLIVDQRRPNGVRKAASEIGISAATLSRVENGKMPDLTTFTEICKWLGKSPAEFLGGEPQQENSTKVSIHLRKKDASAAETAKSLARMIVAAQDQLAERMRR